MDGRRRRWCWPDLYECVCVCLSVHCAFTISIPYSSLKIFDLVFFFGFPCRLSLLTFIKLFPYFESKEMGNHARIENVCRFVV